MMEDGIEIDNVAMNTVISACAASWTMALQIFDTMENWELIGFNSLLSCCSKAGHWMLALHFLHDPMVSLQRLDPNVISFSCVISACDKAGNAWQLALAVLQLMSKQKVAPNVISFSNAISACEKCGRWEFALELLSVQLEADLHPDGVSYNSAISACEKAAEWERAVAMSMAMPEAKLHPDVVTYNSIIAACERCGIWAKALELLNLMEEAVVTPDVITFSLLMASLSLELSPLRMEEARKHGDGSDSNALGNYFRIQKTPRIILAVPALEANILVAKNQRHGQERGAAISACEKGFQWTWALHLMQRMLKQELIPDVICWNSLVSACARSYAWQVALSCMETPQDEVTLSAMCCAAEKGNAWSQLLALLQTAQHSTLQPEILSHNSGILALGSRWRRILELLQHMKRRRLRSNVATYAAAEAVLQTTAQHAGWLHGKLSDLGHDIITSLWKLRVFKDARDDDVLSDVNGRTKKELGERERLTVFPHMAGGSRSSCTRAPIACGSGCFLPLLEEEDRTWSSFLAEEANHEGGQILHGLPAICAHEELFLKKIRSLRKCPSSSHDRLAVAFSGGGVRAAFVATGVLWRLAACGRLKDVDYISGVSGGTYAATAFASHVVAAGKPAAGEELDGWYLRIVARMKLRSTFQKNM
eukprot:symbB.v1.2.007899.t1/scaffold491.1/size196728/3